MHRALTIVAFVLRHQADADALQELNEVVSNFIGPDPNLSLAAACSLGSTRLLNWIWNASAASKEERTSRWTLGNYLRSEPKYHQWQFQKAVGWQSQEGSWVWSSGCLPTFQAVSCPSSSWKTLLRVDGWRSSSSCWSTTLGEIVHT
ncbi:hypothetical protein PF010_g24568 [Phytophthora fragariae]|uniref:Uncharacterized protein n=1 Tax=Phytophthora fragariae TaxID=53985 RepID=A0A6G0K2D2_9STRA|nr:hypothetical protein PF010_g24568 [Phytophthora fragariae]KAE9183579.1 hypothetical protein PF004_g23912 [Phytophthora fragariae]